MNRQIRNDLIRKQICTFIPLYREAHGYSPTYREIGQNIGLSSSSSVYNHINQMLKCGMLERDDIDKHRSLKVCTLEISAFQ